MFLCCFSVFLIQLCSQYGRFRPCLLTSTHLDMIPSIQNTWRCQNMLQGTNWLKHAEKIKLWICLFLTKTCKWGDIPLKNVQRHVELGIVGGRWTHQFALGVGRNHGAVGEGEPVDGTECLTVSKNWRRNNTLCQWNYLCECLWSSTMRPQFLQYVFLVCISFCDFNAICTINTPKCSAPSRKSLL